MERVRIIKNDGTAKEVSVVDPTIENEEKYSELKLELTSELQRMFAEAKDIDGGSNMEKLQEKILANPSTIENYSDFTRKVQKMKREHLKKVFKLLVKYETPELDDAEFWNKQLIPEMNRAERLFRGSAQID